MKLVHYCFVICALLPIAFGYRILGVFPVPSKSHYYVGRALMQALAERGHEVTVISPFKEKKQIENYTEVFIENSYNWWLEFSAKDNFVNYDQPTAVGIILAGYKLATKITEWTFRSQNFQKFLKTEQHFDVIIVEVCLVEALYGLMHSFDAPVVGISAFGASKWTTDLVGTPNFASYVPYTKMPFTDRMTFWERFYNSLVFWTEDILYPYYHLQIQQQLMEKYFPNAKNWPSLAEIQKNISLVLLNTHVTFGTARPYAPNMIEVGGMQIRQKLKPLPENVQMFLDGAKNGAIFFSLGSNVLLTKLPPHHFDAIQNAFSDNPNVRILIKSDEKISIPSHEPEDVLIESWFDQQSILAHPNIKLFVTHGGLLSITESIHFGKPMVGISVFFDQHLNTRIAEQKGYGIRVPLRELSLEKLKSAINKVLGDASYVEQAKLTSERYHDLLKNPLETGIFWVEHVAKNKGAPHLRSVAVDLTFYQLYNLDCWGLVFIILLLICYALRTFMRLVISLILSNVMPNKTKTS